MFPIINYFLEKYLMKYTVFSYFNEIQMRYQVKWITWLNYWYQKCTISGVWLVVIWRENWRRRALLGHNLQCAECQGTYVLYKITLGASYNNLYTSVTYGTVFHVLVNPRTSVLCVSKKLLNTVQHNMFMWYYCIVWHY